MVSPIKNGLNVLFFPITDVNVKVTWHIYFNVSGSPTTNCSKQLKNVKITLLCFVDQLVSGWRDKIT